MKKMDLVQNNRLYCVEFSKQLEVVVEQNVVEMMKVRMKVMTMDWITTKMDVVVR
jgi:hypothetical protein